MTPLLRWLRSACALWLVVVLVVFACAVSLEAAQFVFVGMSLGYALGYGDAFADRLRGVSRR